MRWVRKVTGLLAYLSRSVAEAGHKMSGFKKLGYTKFTESVSQICVSLMEDWKFVTERTRTVQLPQHQFCFIVIATGRSAVQRF